MSHETRIVTRRRVLVELVLLAGMAGTPVAWGQTVIYVDARATGAGNGASWADAFTKVQPALNAAQSGDQVWVAAGRYVENITLKNGVALYGGFAGTETELGQRNWVVNETILDGNQAGSGVSGPAQPGYCAGAKCPCQGPDARHRMAFTVAPACPQCGGSSRRRS